MSAVDYDEVWEMVRRAFRDGLERALADQPPLVKNFGRTPHTLHGPFAPYCWDSPLADSDLSCDLLEWHDGDHLHTLDDGRTIRWERE